MPTPRKPSPDPERHTLVKYLVAAGLGSRRHCAALVMAGYVTVNGEPADSLMREVSFRDRIEVDGRPVQAKRGVHVYLAAHKPDGYLSAVTDSRERDTVLDLVPRALRRNGLVPAGRLDLHSTGLMLLTTDGELVNRITHPRYEVEKEYHVALDRAVQPAASSKLRTGVEIESGTAHAKALRRLQEEPGFRYSVTLIEGKKREVRLMFRAVGREVLELQRVRIGSLTLGNLREGEVRELTDREVSDLKRLVGILDPLPAAGRSLGRPEAIGAPGGKSSRPATNGPPSHPTPHGPVPRRDAGPPARRKGRSRTNVVAERARGSPAGAPAGKPKPASPGRAAGQANRKRRTKR